MKIYTKTGDAGETSLYGGRRVKKNDETIEAIGDVDELNSAIGVVIAAMDEDAEREFLQTIQHRLFTIGSNLACLHLDFYPPNIPRLTREDVESLERWIDSLQENLPPMTQFILPMGSRAAAFCFLTRAVCRRAERSIIRLRSLYSGMDHHILQYLNRLSDALFVLGRLMNFRQGVGDIQWKK